MEWQLCFFPSSSNTLGWLNKVLRFFFFVLNYLKESFALFLHANCYQKRKLQIPLVEIQW